MASNSNNYIALAMGLDVTDLRSGVTEAKRQLGQFETEFQKTTASMDNWRKSEEGLEARLDSLRKKLSTQKSIIAGYRAEIQHVEQQEGDHTAELQALNAQLDKAEIAYGKTQRSINYYQRQLKDLKSDTRELAQANQEVANTTQIINRGFTVLKGVLANFATDAIRGVINGFKNAISSGIEFESSFTDVIKTVDATDDQLMELEQGIRRLALSIPQTASEIATVASLAGQLGIATDSILDFTRVMIMLGDATNLSSDEAASALARFANVMGMSEDNYQRLGSSIVALGNNFATTESEIVEMAQRISSTGVQVGLTEQEVLALATALSSLGIQAEAGGTSISRILSDMLVAVETESDALNDYAKVAGVTAEQFSEAFRRSASEGLQMFVDGLHNMGESGESVIVTLENMGITAVRERQAILSLASGNDVLRRAIDTSNEAWEKNVALVNEANTRYATTESQLNIMKNAWRELGLQIYDEIQPALQGLFGWLTDIAEAFTGNIDAGEQLQGAVNDVITAFENYRKAQEDAKTATDETTEAMLRQSEQAIITAVTTASARYSESRAEINRLQNSINRNNRTLGTYEGDFNAIISEVERRRNTTLNRRDIYRNLEILLSNAPSQDLTDARDNLYYMGFSLDQIQEMQDFYPEFAKIREEIKEITSQIDLQTDQMIDAITLAHKAVRDGIMTYEELDEISIYFSDAVRELGDAYEYGYQRQQTAIEISKDNEELLEGMLPTLRNFQAQYERGTKEYIEYAGAIDAVTEALKALREEMAKQGGGGGTGGTEGGEEDSGGSNERTPQDVFDSTTKSAEVATQLASLLGTEANSLNRQLVSIYQNGIRSLLNMGVDVNDELIQDLLKRWQEASDAIETTPTTTPKKDESILAGLIGLGGFDDELREAINKVKNAYDEIAGYANRLISGITDVVSNIYQAQINQIDAQLAEIEDRTEELIESATAQANQRQAILNAQYEQGAITEEEYYKGSSDAQREALTKQIQAEKQAQDEREALEEQRDELARKQFEANKANQIAQVWINLGSAIMTTYAQSGWLLGSIFAALLTAQAGAQTAAIASQQYTSALAKGGIVDEPTMALVGEAGKEAVMPLENNTGWIRELAYQLTDVMNGAEGVTRTTSINNSRTQTFNQVVNSPKALSRKDIYRQTKELLRIAGRR